MVRAQGSLEYLVIIAVVLAIAGVTVLYITGVFNSQNSQVSVAACKQASQTCKLSQLSSPNDPCLACATACVSQTTGKEVFNGAIYCCNHTQSDLIYTNSPGCGGGYTYGPGDIYFDQFTNLNGWTGGSSSCTDTGGWCINNSGYTGTAAYMDSHGTYSINRTQSTVGYKSIQISFQAKTCGDPGGLSSQEYLKVDWSGDGGSTWNTLLDTNIIAPWVLESYTLPSSADENPNFVIRITAYDSHLMNGAGSSYCAPYYTPNGLDHSQIDDLKITGLHKL